jgi:arylsulfatase A-like enzyme
VIVGESDTLTTQHVAQGALPGRDLLAASLEGSLFWLAYGATELGMCTLLPLLKDSLSVVTAVAWQWTGVLLLGYAVAGAATGALATLAFDWLETARGKRNPGSKWLTGRYAGGLVLAMAYTAGVLLRSPGRRAVLLAVALTLALGSACFRGRWVYRFERVLRPWPIALLLLVAPAATFELFNQSPRNIRVAGWRAILGVIAVASFASGRIRGPLADGYRPNWRRRFAIPLGAIFIFGGCAMLVSFHRTLDRSRAAASLSGTARGRPNVVLLTLDTVRTDHTSLGGYDRDTTPNLRRFSQDAVVYSNVSAVADQTLSTHASMFTGLYPRQHGAVPFALPGERAGRPLAASVPTLAEVLVANGYVTMGLVANSILLTPSWGLSRGFEVYDVHSVVPIEQQDTGYVRALARTLLGLCVPTQEFDRLFRRSEDVNRHAFALLDEVKRRGASFFLFLNYMDAHAPYVPPPPFDRRYPGKSSVLTGSRYNELSQISGNISLTAQEHRALVSQYDGAIAYEDQQLGRLLDKLKSLGLYDNTLILITADHGEHLGDHGLLFHAKSVYQSLIHVPLVIKYPGSRKAAVVRAPVSQIDFMPTILSALGIGASPALPGLDLQTINHAPPRVLVSVAYEARGIANQRETALIANGNKLIESTLGTRELYNIDRDPAEKIDLYRANAPLSRRMRAYLSQWLRAIHAFHSQRQTNMDSENIRRLKSLGYVQ